MDSPKPWFYWLPRILGALFVIFLGLFGLDAFDGDGNNGELILAFVIHLIPALLVLLALFISFFNERRSALIFIALGITYFFISRGNSTAVLIISGPLIVIGIMIILAAARKAKY